MLSATVRFPCWLNWVKTMVPNQRSTKIIKNPLDPFGRMTIIWKQALYWWFHPYRTHCACEKCPGVQTHPLCTWPLNLRPTFYGSAPYSLSQSWFEQAFFTGRHHGSSSVSNAKELHRWCFSTAVKAEELNFCRAWNMRMLRRHQLPASHLLIQPRYSSLQQRTGLNIQTRQVEYPTGYYDDPCKCVNVSWIPYLRLRACHSLFGESRHAKEPKGVLLQLEAPQ